MEKSKQVSLQTIVPLPPGPLLKIGSKLLPGVAKVQKQIEPYAKSWDESNARVLQQTGPVWVVLGDSMSQSIGASSYDHGWVNQLHDIMQNAGTNYRILNLSMTGARIEHVTNVQIPALATLDIHPDLVTILVGANDIISPRYRRRAVAQFHRLLDALPDSKIVFGPVANVGVGATINELIRTQPVSRNITIVNEEIKSWRGKLSADHFHPNDAGYAAIARTFANKVVPAQ